MNQKEIIKEKVLRLAQEAIRGFSVEIEDVEIIGHRGRMIVRIIIDSQDGISINDCERVSRQIEALLDIEDPIPTSYTLEVSSPGLDRPLKSIKDYKRFISKLVRIITKEKLNNQTFFIGRIKAVEGDEILLQINNHTEVRIPFNIIAKANLEVEF